MQQTQNLKFNLIEPSDPISPAPLNENAQKLEAALLTKTSETRADSLEQRILTLEAHKMAYGTYTGGAEAAQGIQLGFTPGLVIIKRSGAGSTTLYQSVTVAGVDLMDAHGTFLAIIPGGFRPGKTMNNSCNDVKETYYYFAIG